jgi:hypothetical protein
MSVANHRKKSNHQTNNSEFAEEVLAKNVKHAAQNNPRESANENQK